MINSIVGCVWCGQQNRVPEAWAPGKKLRCGACQGPVDPSGGAKVPLDLDVDDEDVDDDDDEDDEDDDDDDA